MILEQYKDAKNLLEILKNADLKAEEVGQALEEVGGVYLETAIGHTLDMIGAVFGVERNGMVDWEYKAEIAKKSALRFSGTPEEIVAMVKSAYGGTRASYEQDAPASFVIDTDAEITDAQLDALAPAGVRAHALTDDRNYLLHMVPRSPVPQVGGGFIYLMEGTHALASVEDLEKFDLGGGGHLLVE